MAWKGRTASPGSSASGSRCSAARSTPIADASMTSASSRADSTRAARSGMVALSSASRTVMPELGGSAFEPLAALEVPQRAGELVELAGEDGVEVVGRVLDAVIRHAPLREVVGADLLRPLARADLCAALGRLGRLLLGELLLVQARPEHAHRLLAVLQLGLLVLHRDHHAGRLVGDAHGRVGGVDRLAAGTGGAVDVDLEVVGVDVDVDVLGLGQDGHRGGRRVDAALRLRLGHALDPVGAALVLEHRIRPVALDGERVGAVGGLERLDLEPAPVGVAAEHAVEVAGPDRRLVAAGTGPDLHDDVLVVVWVALEHGQADLLLELLHAPAGGLEHLPHLGVVGALVEELLGAGGVVGGTPPLLGEPRRRLEIAVGAPGLGQAAAVPDHVGVGHVLLGLRVAGLDLVDELLDQGSDPLRVLAGCCLRVYAPCRPLPPAPPSSAIRPTGTAGPSWPSRSTIS